MTILTTERLEAEQQAIFERLLDLEDHFGRKLLDSAAVAGVTRERRADVLAGFATLWTLYKTYRTVVARVAATMARRSRPTPADLHEVEQLVAEIQVGYGRVHEVVTAVDRVWTELSPRIDRCDTLLHEARACAAELGLPAELADLADRLDDVRRTAVTDPLRLWVDDAVDLVEADRLMTRCVAIHADLQMLGELPQHAQRRLDQVGTTLTEIGQLDQEISAQRRLTHAKIHAVPGPEPAAQPANPLGPRLADATELCRHGHWRQLGTELPALERDVDTALRQARVELAETGRPLRERAELRGRLSAYRAKAAGLGRIEDLTLEQRYQRARDLLWCAPCDLVAATTAVTDYQDAVNTTVPDQDLT